MPILETATRSIPSLETSRRRCLLTGVLVLWTSVAFASSSPPPEEKAGSPVAASGEARSPTSDLEKRLARRAVKAQAQQAYYGQKDFVSCARLYEAAGEAYSAACCHALGGNSDAAFTQLALAIDGKFRDLSLLDRDTDFTTLRDDPRWATERARLEAKLAAADGVHPELQRIFQEDQADRRVGPNQTIDWSQVGARDKERRARVEAILAAGGAKYSIDYFNAAMVFQHGESREDIQRAFELALEATKLDPENDTAWWLAAAAEDRKLLFDEKPQKWGTQFKMIDGKWVVWPVDPAITDAQRAEWNVPPLAAAHARAERMNANLPKP